MGEFIKFLKRFSLKSTLNILYQRSSNVHPISEQERKKLQRVLIEIYSDIFRACEKHRIKPFLQGGTLLGKFRHNGFIPWDDDLDLGMARDDYEKFKRIFQEELGREYILKGPGCPEGATNRFIQVFRKNTYYKTVGMSDSIPHHIYVDIFPIDYAPDKRGRRIIKGLWCNCLMAISGSVEFKKTLTREMREIMKRTFAGRMNMRIRLIIGTMFSFRSLNKWYRTIDRVLVEREKTAYCTSGTGRKHYLGEIVKTEVFFPLKRSEFEGHPAWILNQSEEYLKNLYGDYMKIPDEKDREQHFIEELKIDSE